MTLVSLLPSTLKTTMLWTRILSSRTPQKQTSKGNQNTKFVTVQSALRVEDKIRSQKWRTRKEDVDKKSGEKGLKWHQKGGTLYTTHVTGIWRDFIKTYDNTSYIEGVKRLRAKSTYFMLEKTARITYNMHKLMFYSSKKNLQLFFQTKWYFTSGNELEIYQKLSTVILLEGTILTTEKCSYIVTSLRTSNVTWWKLFDYEVEIALQWRMQSSCLNPCCQNLVD